MTNRNIVLPLAKVLIAAAWADGDLDNAELNALKDLLFNFPNLSGEDWSQLEIYMETPVCEEEANRLLKDLTNSLKTDEDKKLVHDALEQLFQADGKITDEERSRMAVIEKAVEGTAIGVIGLLGRSVGSLLLRREEIAASAPNREERIEDFIENRVYFRLLHEMENEGEQWEIPHEHARKLCLAAGLMAHIAWIDNHLDPGETKAIGNCLRQDWNLDSREAELVARISCDAAMKGLDRFRLCRGFFEITTPIERENFIKCLFHVANSAQNTTNEEIEEIRVIANLLRVRPEKFIEAKLTIPREDRGRL